jgi:O-antigen/teichoic acid export membrane protein
MNPRNLANRFMNREYAILGFMVVATFIASFSNYSFNIIAARWLGKDEYGALASLLSVFLIFSVPTTAFQAIMAKYVAIYKVKGESSKISSLLVGSIKILAIAGGTIFLIFAGMSGLISRFLNVDSPASIVVLGSAIAMAGLYPIFLGTLQGYQFFGHMGSNMMVQAFIRVLVGIFLIKIGWGIAGAMGASTLALTAAIILAYFQGGSIFDLRYRREKIDFREIFREFLPAIVILAIFWSYTGVDVIIAKRVLSSSLAGDYACAVFMGKIILFLPTAVSMVMFPKTAELRAQHTRTVKVFLKYFLVGVLLSGLAGAMYLIVPRTLISILYGSEYLNAATVMGTFGVAMTLYTAVNILIMYFISIKITRIPIIVMSVALSVEVMLMSLFARTLMQFALIHLFMAGALVMLLFLPVMLINSSEKGWEEPENTKK